MEPTTVLMRIEDIGSRERVPEEHIVTVMLRVYGCADASAASQFVSNRLRGDVERKSEGVT